MDIMEMPCALFNIRFLNGFQHVFQQQITTESAKSSLTSLDLRTTNYHNETKKMTPDGDGAVQVLDRADKVGVHF